MRGDYFGAGRFLHEQRYSYLGDVYACGAAGEQTAKAKVDRARTLTQKKSTKNPAEEETTLQKTLCLFLSQAQLYLIPYYDLHRLRQLNLTDSKLKNATKKCQKEYHSVLRQMKK